MRITEVHVYQKDLPIVDGPYVMSTMTLESVDTTIVKIVGSDGTTGWGEVAPLGPVYQPQHAMGARAAIAQLAQGLIGYSCLAPRLLHRRMNELLSGHNYAKAAIECAVMDILGKHHNVRVCDLLGGAVREQLPGYFAISKGEPSETVRIAKDKIKLGYQRLQIKVGGRDVAIDIEAIHKVWEAVGTQARLVVDANRAMTASQAIHLSQACRNIPFMFEQPCNTMEEIASLRNKIVHPVALDECVENINDVLRAISSNVCDGFGFKLSRMGGLLPTATLRDVCEARGLPHTIEDSWGGDIVFSAVLQMAATVKPEMLEGVWTASNYVQHGYDPGQKITFDNGVYQLPTGAGLGIEPQLSLIGDLHQSFS